MFTTRRHGAFLMKTRSIHTRIWGDGWFEKLNWSEKLLFIYVITNEHINLPGIYELSDRRILVETGLTTPQLGKAKISLKGKVLFYNGWVIVKNIEKYDNFKGGKLEIAKNSQLKEIPKEIIDLADKLRQIDTLSIEYLYPIDTPNSNSNSNSNRGIVKGDLSEGDLQEIADKYKIPLSVVKLSKEEMDNWMAAKGKVYKDYKAGLRNWVLRDAKKQIETGQTKKGGVHDATHIG